MRWNLLYNQGKLLCFSAAFLCLSAIPSKKQLPKNAFNTGWLDWEIIPAFLKRRIPCSVVQGSSWTCRASCAPSGAAFPNDAVGLTWQCRNTACNLLLVPKGLKPVWASYPCELPTASIDIKQGLQRLLDQSSGNWIICLHESRGPWTSSGCWILEYGKFIVALLLMFQHQREPVL